MKHNILKSKFTWAFIAGCICSLAFAPFHFLLAAMLSLSFFYILLEESTDKKESFYVGFAYGFGYFLSGIYWISISLLVDAKTYAWLIPFALTLIPSALALYIALFAFIYKIFTHKLLLTKSYQKILLFAVMWLVFEILRSTLFSGFPWNLLGYIWLVDVNFAQLGKIFGIYGLSLFAVLICLFPAIFVKRDNFKSAAEVALGDKILAIILLLIFVANYAFGYFLISKNNLTYNNEINLRLVQANIKQNMKWEDEQKYANFIKHIELSNSKSLEDVSAVIWPETAIPYAINDSAELMTMLNKATPKNGILLSGGLRVQYDYKKRQLSRAWNSIFAFNSDGIIEKYDKHHLVPFGEYIPLQKYLPFLSKLTEGSLGFSKGEGPQTIKANNFSFSPLICYEVIFSDATLDKESRPDLLLNLTNDAWFGTSSGPYQHLDMAKMRAIEYGIPLARAANTGVTAFIDPFGRILNRINLNQEGFFDIKLIEKLAPTIYEKYSYLPLEIVLCIMLLILIFSPKSNNVRSKITK